MNVSTPIDQRTAVTLEMLQKREDNQQILEVDYETWQRSTGVRPGKIGSDTKESFERINQEFVKKHPLLANIVNSHTIVYQDASKSMKKSDQTITNLKNSLSTPMNVRFQKFISSIMKLPDLKKAKMLQISLNWIILYRILLERNISKTKMEIVLYDYMSETTEASTPEKTEYFDQHLGTHGISHQSTQKHRLVICLDDNSSPEEIALLLKYMVKIPTKLSKEKFTYGVRKITTKDLPELFQLKQSDNKGVSDLAEAFISKENRAHVRNAYRNFNREDINFISAAEQLLKTDEDCLEIFDLFPGLKPLLSLITASELLRIDSVLVSTDDIPAISPENKKNVCLLNTLLAGKESLQSVDSCYNDLHSELISLYDKTTKNRPLRLNIIKCKQCLPPIEPLLAKPLPDNLDSCKAFSAKERNLDDILNPPKKVEAKPSIPAKKPTPKKKQDEKTKASNIHKKMDVFNISSSSSSSSSSVKKVEQATKFPLENLSFLKVSENIIQCHPHVLRWKKYTPGCKERPFGYVGMITSLFNDMIARHRFHPLVDRLVNNKAFAYTSGTNTFMLGTLQFDDGRVESGIFEYGRGSVNKELCIHRYFNKRPPTDMLKAKLDEHTYGMVFPMIDTPMSDGDVDFTDCSFDFPNSSYDPVLGILSIRDEEMKMTIHVYKKSEVELAL